MRLSWFVASRIGKGRKGRLASLGNVIAVFSVAASILVIIISICVSRGFRKEILDKMAAFDGDVNISVMPPVAGEGFNTAEYSLPGLKAGSKVLELPYVTHFQALSYRPAMVKTADNIQGVMLKGVDSSFNWSFCEKNLMEGSLPKKEAEDFALISNKLADMMGFSAGSKATFYFVGDNVRVRRLTVCGVFTAQLENLDKNQVITSKKLVNSLNGWEEDRASAYQVLFSNHSEKQYYKRKMEIAELVYSNMEDGQFPRISGAYEDLGNLVDWLRLLDMNVMIILVLMIAVAAFNMVSCNLIILFENISSIGVLKSLGMKDSGIKKVFLAKSASIVAKGLLAGNVLALCLLAVQASLKVIRLNPDNYFISYVPVDISWWAVVLADVLCFAAIMAILLIPSHFISRIQPSKTIRMR